MSKRVVPIVTAAVLIVVSIIFYTQFTLFVVPPIGAVPEGKTILISRLNITNFVDSSDAMCERTMGGVSLLCRGMFLGGVIEKSKIHARLPYSRTLYLISTDGKTYEWTQP